MPSTGDNFTLAELAAATGDTTPDYSLSQSYGGTTSNLDFEDFSIGSVQNITLNTTSVPYNGKVVATMNFTTVGRFFNDKIANRNQNFVWSQSHTLTILPSYLQGRVAEYTNGFGGCNQSFTVTIRGSFNDKGFNDHAPGYATTFNSPNITVYGPPTPSLSLASTIGPFNPLNTGGGCSSRGYGAQINVNVNLGSYQGVNGSSVAGYVNYNDGSCCRALGVFSGNFNTGRTLCGGQSYYVYVTNNFGCQSSSILVTTPAYV